MTASEPTVIDIRFPEADRLQLTIAVGACRLEVRPGPGERWVMGTYSDPTGTLPSKITQEGGRVRISQEHTGEIRSMSVSEPPRFDLALGSARPFELTLETGASESIFDLGGVPVQALTIRQGAGKVTFDFSAPNPAAMQQLTLQAGASGVEMRNLGNANFAQMNVEGGAAGYFFDFGGALQQEASARISTGVSQVSLFFPPGCAAKVTAEMVMGGLNVGDGFTKKDGAYWTSAAMEGGMPLLSVRANVTLGELKIRVKDQG